MLKHELLQKATSMFVGTIFTLFSIFEYAQPAYGSPSERVSEYTSLIPAELGAVEESHKGENAKTILYIQDAHDSLEAQEKIAALIEYLVTHQDVKTVFEEGYEGVVPTDEYFGSIEDPGIKEKVSYFLMDKLRIGGAEYAHINRTKDFNLIGVDNIDLHLKTISWYQASAKTREQTQEDLDQILKEITKLAHQHFPKELKEWMKLKTRFEEENLSLIDYLRRSVFLRLAVKNIRPSLRDSVPGDVEAISEAKLLARQEVWQASRPFGAPRNGVMGAYPLINLILHAEKSKDSFILKQLNSIDSQALFSEIARLESDLRSEYLKTERDMQIFDYHQALSLLKRLSEIKLSQQEYEAVKNILKEVNTESLAQFIVKHTKRPLILRKLWEEMIHSSLNFYETAKARDSTIESHLDPFINNPEEHTAILIFGGFHKSNIKEILERKKLSYHIISPEITEIDKRHQDYYQHLMSDGYHPFETPHYLRHAARAESRFVQAKLGGLEAAETFRAELRALTQSITNNPSTSRDLLHRQMEESLQTQPIQRKSESARALQRSEVRSRPERNGSEPHDASQSTPSEGRPTRRMFLRILLASAIVGGAYLVWRIPRRGLFVHHLEARRNLDSSRRDLLTIIRWIERERAPGLEVLGRFREDYLKKKGKVIAIDSTLATMGKKESKAGLQFAISPLAWQQRVLTVRRLRAPEAEIYALASLIVRDPHGLEFMAHSDPEDDVMYERVQRLLALKLEGAYETFLREHANVYEEALPVLLAGEVYELYHEMRFLRWAYERGLMKREKIEEIFSLSYVDVMTWAVLFDEELDWDVLLEENEKLLVKLIQLEWMRVVLVYLPAYLDLLEKLQRGEKPEMAPTWERRFYSDHALLQVLKGNLDPGIVHVAKAVHRAHSVPAPAVPYRDRHMPLSREEASQVFDWFEPGSQRMKDRIQSFIRAVLDRISKAARSEARSGRRWGQRGIAYGVFIEGMKKELRPVTTKFSRRIEKGLTPSAIWSEEDGLAVQETAPPHLKAYVNSHRDEIDQKLRRLVKDIGVSREIALHYTHFSVPENPYFQYDFSIPTGLRRRDLVHQELLSFRDSEGRIHMPLVYFVPSVDPEMLHALAVEGAFAAVIAEKPLLLKKLKEHAREVLFHSDLISFPMGRILEEQMTFEDTIPLLKQVQFLRAMWAFIAQDDRVRRATSEGQKETALKQTYLEHIGRYVSFMSAAAADTLRASLEPWFSSEVTLAIRDYVKYGRARNLDHLTVDDLRKAGRHVVVLPEKIFHEMLSQAAMDLVDHFTSPLAEWEWQTLRHFTETGQDQGELLSGLLQQHDVLLIQSHRLDMEDFLPLLEANGLWPRGTLLALPLRRATAKEEGYDVDVTWRFLFRDKLASFKDIAEAVNGYLLNGDDQGLIALAEHFRNSRAGSERILKEMKTSLEKLRELNQNGADIRYFPSFVVHRGTEIPNTENLETRFRSYLTQLKEYARESGALKIVQVQDLPQDDPRHELTHIQKPSRNAPDLLHTLPRAPEFFGEDVVAAVHVTYDLRHGGLSVPLYRVFEHWQGGSFGAPVNSSFAELTVSSYERPGDTYVFGNFGFVFFTIKRKPDDRGGSSPDDLGGPLREPMPEPTEGLVVPIRSEARDLELKPGGFRGSVDHELRLIKQAGEAEDQGDLVGTREVGINLEAAGRGLSIHELYPHLGKNGVNLGPFARSDSPQSGLEQPLRFQSVPDGGGNHGIRSSGIDNGEKGVAPASGLLEPHLAPDAVNKEPSSEVMRLQGKDAADFQGDRLGHKYALLTPQKGGVGGALSGNPSVGAPSGGSALRQGLRRAHGGLQRRSIVPDTGGPSGDNSGKPNRIPVGYLSEKQPSSSFLPPHHLFNNTEGSLPSLAYPVRSSEVRQAKVDGENEKIMRHSVLRIRGDKAVIEANPKYPSLIFIDLPVTQAWLHYHVPGATHRPAQELRYYFEWSTNHPLVYVSQRPMRDEGAQRAAKPSLNLYEGKRETPIDGFFSIQLQGGKLVIKRLIGKSQESGDMVIFAKVAVRSEVRSGESAAGQPRKAGDLSQNVSNEIQDAVLSLIPGPLFVEKGIDQESVLWFRKGEDDKGLSRENPVIRLRSGEGNLEIKLGYKGRPSAIAHLSFTEGAQDELFLNAFSLKNFREAEENEELKNLGAPSFLWWLAKNLAPFMERVGFKTLVFGTNELSPIRSSGVLTKLEFKKLEPGKLEDLRRILQARRLKSTGSTSNSGDRRDEDLGPLRPEVRSEVRAKEPRLRRIERLINKASQLQSGSDIPLTALQKAEKNLNVALSQLNQLLGPSSLSKVKAESAGKWHYVAQKTLAYNHLNQAHWYRRQRRYSEAQEYYLKAYDGWAELLDLTLSRRLFLKHKVSTVVHLLVTLIAWSAELSRKGELKEAQEKMDSARVILDLDGAFLEEIFTRPIGWIELEMERLQDWLDEARRQKIDKIPTGDNLARLHADIQYELFQIQWLMERKPWEFYQLATLEGNEAQSIKEIFENFQDLAHDAYERISSNQAVDEETLLKVRRAFKELTSLLVAIFRLQTRQAWFPHPEPTEGKDPRIRRYSFEFMWDGVSFEAAVLMRLASRSEGQSRVRLSVLTPREWGRTVFGVVFTNLRIDYDPTHNLPSGTMDLPDGLRSVVPSKSLHHFPIKELLGPTAFETFVMEMDRKMRDLNSALSERAEARAGKDVQREINWFSRLKEEAKARAAKMHEYNRELLGLFRMWRELKNSGKNDAATVVLRRIRDYAEKLKQFADYIAPDPDSPDPQLEIETYRKIADFSVTELKDKSRNLDREIKAFSPRFIEAYQDQNSDALERLNRDVVPLYKARIKTQLRQAQHQLLQIRLNESAVLTLLAALVHNYLRLSQEYAWRWRRAVARAAVERIKVVGRHGQAAIGYDYENFRIFREGRREGETKQDIVMVQNRWRKQVLEDGSVTYRLDPTRIRLADLDTAFRSQVHTLEAQEQDYAQILFRLGALDYVRDLVNTYKDNLPGHLLDQIKSNIAEVQEGMGGLSRGVSHEKRLASQSLEAALAQIQAGKYQEALGLLDGAIGDLKSRLTVIETERKGVQARADYIAHRIRVEETWKAANELEQLFEREQFQEGANLLDLIYQTHYLPIASQVPQYESLQGYIARLKAHAHRAAALKKLGQPTEPIIKRIREDLRRVQNMTRPKHRAEARLSSSDGTLRIKSLRRFLLGRIIESGVLGGGFDIGESRAEMRAAEGEAEPRNADDIRRQIRFLDDEVSPFIGDLVAFRLERASLAFQLFLVFILMMGTDFVIRVMLPHFDPGARHLFVILAGFLFVFTYPQIVKPWFLRVRQDRLVRRELLRASEARQALRYDIFAWWNEVAESQPRPESVERIRSLISGLEKYEDEFLHASVRFERARLLRAMELAEREAFATSEPYEDIELLQVTDEAARALEDLFLQVRAYLESQREGVRWLRSVISFENTELQKSITDFLEFYDGYSKFTAKESAVPRRAEVRKTNLQKFTDQGSKRAGFKRSMVGHRERGAHARPLENDMRSPLADQPASSLERFYSGGAGNISRKFAHSWFVGGELGSDPEEPASFMAPSDASGTRIEHPKAITNRGTKVLARFHDRFPFTHTTRERRTLGNVATGLVRIHDNVPLHYSKHSPAFLLSQLTDRAEARTTSPSAMPRASRPENRSDPLVSDFFRAEVRNDDENSLTDVEAIEETQLPARLYFFMNDSLSEGEQNQFYGYVHSALTWPSPEEKVVKWVQGTLAYQSLSTEERLKLDSDLQTHKEGIMPLLRLAYARLTESPKVLADRVTIPSLNHVSLPETLYQVYPLRAFLEPEAQQVVEKLFDAVFLKDQIVLTAQEPRLLAARLRDFMTEEISFGRILEVFPELESQVPLADAAKEKISVSRLLYLLMRFGAPSRGFTLPAALEPYAASLRQTGLIRVRRFLPDLDDSNALWHPAQVEFLWEVVRRLFPVEPWVLSRESFKQQLIASLKLRQPRPRLAASGVKVPAIRSARERLVWDQFDFSRMDRLQKFLLASGARVLDSRKEPENPRQFRIHLTKPLRDQIRKEHVLSIQGQYVGKNVVIVFDRVRRKPEIQKLLIYENRLSGDTLRDTYLPLKQGFYSTRGLIQAEVGYRFTHPLFPGETFYVSTKRGFNRQNQLNQFRVITNSRDQIQEIRDSGGRSLSFFPLRDNYEGRRIGTVVLRHHNISIRRRDLRAVIQGVPLRSTRDVRPVAYVPFRGNPPKRVAPAKYIGKKADLKIEDGHIIEAKIGKKLFPQILKRDPEGKIVATARQCFQKSLEGFSGSIVRFQANRNGIASLGPPYSGVHVADASKEPVWMSAVVDRGVLVRSDEWSKLPPPDVYDLKRDAFNRLQVGLRRRLRSRKTHHFTVLRDFKYTPLRSFKGRIPRNVYEKHSGIITGLRPNARGQITLVEAQYRVPPRYQGHAVEIFKFPSRNILMIVVYEKDEKTVAGVFFYQRGVKTWRANNQEKEKLEHGLKREFKYLLDLSTVWSVAIGSEHLFREARDGYRQGYLRKAEELFRKVKPQAHQEYAAAQTYLRKLIPHRREVLAYGSRRLKSAILRRNMAARKRARDREQKDQISDAQNSRSEVRTKFSYRLGSGAIAEGTSLVGPGAKPLAIPRAEMRSGDAEQAKLPSINEIWRRLERLKSEAQSVIEHLESGHYLQPEEQGETDVLYQRFLQEMVFLAKHAIEAPDTKIGGLALKAYFLDSQRFFLNFHNTLNRKVFQGFTGGIESVEGCLGEVERWYLGLTDYLIRIRDIEQSDPVLPIETEERLKESSYLRAATYLMYSLSQELPDVIHRFETLGKEPPKTFTVALRGLEESVSDFKSHDWEKSIDERDDSDELLKTEVKTERRDTYARAEYVLKNIVDLARLVKAKADRLFTERETTRLIGNRTFKALRWLYSNVSMREGEDPYRLGTAIRQALKIGEEMRQLASVRGAIALYTDMAIEKIKDKSLKTIVTLANEMESTRRSDVRSVRKLAKELHTAGAIATIFLVEDDESLLGIMHRKLVAQARKVTDREVSVETETNGRRAYDRITQLLTEGRQLLLITDHGLSGMTGLTVIERLRQEKYTIPVIMYAFWDDAEEAVQQLGNTVFISKSARPELLYGLVTILLRRSEARSRTRLLGPKEKFGQAELTDHTGQEPARIFPVSDVNRNEASNSLNRSFPLLMRSNLPLQTELLALKSNNKIARAEGQTTQGVEWKDAGGRFAPGKFVRFVPVDAINDAPRKGDKRGNNQAGRGQVPDAEKGPERFAGPSFQDSSSGIPPFSGAPQGSSPLGRPSPIRDIGRYNDPLPDGHNIAAGVGNFYASENSHRNLPSQPFAVKFPSKSRSEARSKKATFAISWYLAYLIGGAVPMTGRSDITPLLIGEIPERFLRNSGLGDDEIASGLKILRQAYEEVTLEVEAPQLKSLTVLSALHSRIGGEDQEAPLKIEPRPGEENLVLGPRLFAPRKKVFTFYPTDLARRQLHKDIKAWQSDERIKIRRHLKEFSPSVRHEFRKHGLPITILNQIYSPKEAKELAKGKPFFVYSEKGPYGGTALRGVYSGSDMQPIYVYRDLRPERTDSSPTEVVLNRKSYQQYERWNTLQAILQEIERVSHWLEDRRHIEGVPFILEKFQEVVRLASRLKVSDAIIELSAAKKTAESIGSTIKLGIAGEVQTSPLHKAIDWFIERISALNRSEMRSEETRISKDLKVLLAKERRTGKDWNELLKGLVHEVPSSQDPTTENVAEVSDGRLSAKDIRDALSEHQIDYKEVGMVRSKPGLKKSSEHKHRAEATHGHVTVSIYRSGRRMSIDIFRRFDTGTFLSKITLRNGTGEGLLSEQLARRLATLYGIRSKSFVVGDAQFISFEHLGQTVSLDDRAALARTIAEALSHRSEVRARAAQDSMETLPVQPLIKISGEVAFTIKAEILDQLSGAEFRELLGLKMLNLDQLHILIDDTSSGHLSDRALEFLKLKKVYLGGYDPRLPKGVFTVHFAPFDSPNHPSESLDERTRQLIDAYVGIEEGAFGLGLDLARSEGALHGLSTRNGLLYDPTRYYLAQVQNQLGSYVILSAAA